MVESPVTVLINMISLVINNSISTLYGIYELFVRLLSSLSFVSVIGGPFVFFLSILIIAGVVFVIGKFILKTGKTIILLFVVGLILLWILMLSFMG